MADGALLEMTNQVSGVVLLLMTALRQTYDSNKTDADKDSSAYVTILDEGRSKEASKLYSSALQVWYFSKVKAFWAGQKVRKPEFYYRLDTQTCKVNSVQEACDKYFGVHILEY